MDRGRNFLGLYNTLRGGFFLSSMMKITDGRFCSERSKGCKMVQLGAYLAEPPAYGKYECVLPPTREECIRFLAEECRTVRMRSEALICLNLASPKLEWGLEAADCFYNAGGSLLELNVHGGYERYLKQGKLRAMVLPENRKELYRWVKAFTELEIPLIVKFRMDVIEDYSPILDMITRFNVFAVHFNVRDERTMRPNFNFVRWIKENYDIFLLVSGYVRSYADAKRLFDAGADMVGVAEPTIKDPLYISRIAKGDMSVSNRSLEDNLNG